MVTAAPFTSIALFFMTVCPFRSFLSHLAANSWRFIMTITASVRQFFPVGLVIPQIHIRPIIVAGMEGHPLRCFFHPLPRYFARLKLSKTNTPSTDANLKTLGLSGIEAFLGISIVNCRDSFERFHSPSNVSFKYKEIAPVDS